MFDNDLKDLAYMQEIAELEEVLEQSEAREKELVILCENLKAQIVWIYDKAKNAQKNFNSHNLTIGQAVTVLQDITDSISELKNRSKK